VYKCTFRRNRSTSDQIFYIPQILKKKREYNGILRQLSAGFQKAYDSGEKYCKIFLIKSGIPMKLIRLIKCF